MVENWEIEWNSSMIQHGTGIGTVEFILEKGGNLSDINYVMFDAYNDDTWEPLIKAVAESENSHPDIIRKNMQQQPYGVAGKHGQYDAAQPMNVTQGPGQSVNVAVRSAPELRQQRRLESAFRGRNDPQNASFLDNMRAGNRLQAFKNLVPKAGSQGRMGQFMQGAKKFGQGAKDFATEGVEAGKEYFSERNKRKENKNRATFLEGKIGRLGASRQAIEQETGGQGVLYDERMKRLDQTSDAKDEKKYADELDELRQGATQPIEGFFDKVRRRAKTRRGERMTEEELAAEKRRREAETTTAEVQEQMAENPEARQAAMEDATQGPVTETPKEAQVAPASSEGGIDPFSDVTPADGAPVEAPADDGIDEDLLHRLVGEKGATYQGKRNKGYKGAIDVTRDILSNPDKFKTADDVRGATGKAGKRGLLADAIIEHLGLTPAQAQQVVQAAEQGNPEAKEMVEEAEEKAGGVDPFADVEPEMVNFSSDKHVQSWDALMKQMNLR